MADIYGMAMQGLQIADQGRERKKQKTLSGLISQAYQQPEQRQGLLGQVMAIDANAGMNAQKEFGAMDDQRRAEVSRHAQIFASMPDEMKAQAYPQLAAEVRKITGIPVPDQYDPKFLPMIQQMAGPQQDNTPASIRELQYLQQHPDLAKLDMERRTAGFNRPQIVDVPTGDGGSQQMIFDGTSFRPANYGNGPSGGGGMVLDDALTNAVMQQESGGNPNAVSPAGAQGLMQLMPATQRDPGFGIQPLKDGSPQENVRLGREYLQAMLKRYNGNQQLALAAYNAGPGRVDQALQGAGGDASRAIGMLPAETRKYVPSVQGRMGYTPPKSETKDPSAMMEKLQLAQAMGATPDQMKQMVLGETGGGKPSATMLRQANAAKQKLIDLNAIDQQLALVEQKFEPLKDSFSATPYIGKLIPTEDGKRFDAAVSLLQGQVRKLTRTPGEGAMSDYETKLAQLANPSRSEYESVTADQLQQLRELVATMRQGYQAILEDNGGSDANIQPKETNTQDTSIDALLDKYK